MQPPVSIVIPCLDESAHIMECLNSILESDYPRDKMEIVLVDGGSTDGTIPIIEKMVASYPMISIVHNPRRTIPAAINIGVSASSADIIFRMDAHSTYSPAYVRLGVEGLLRSGAQNVGGGYEIAPADETLIARGIAAVARHPIGSGKGYSRLQTIKEPRFTDFVSFGCFYRKTFAELEGFDERLHRGEDADFNKRLIGKGGRIYFLPDMRFTYRARKTLTQFGRHGYMTGYWAIRANSIAGAGLTLRSLIPATALLGAAALAGAGIFYAGLRLLAALLAAFYFAILVTASVHAAIRNNDKALVSILPMIFMILHASHAAGSIKALSETQRGTR